MHHGPDELGPFRQPPRQEVACVGKTQHSAERREKKREREGI